MAAALLYTEDEELLPAKRKMVLEQRKGFLPRVNTQRSPAFALTWPLRMRRRMKLTRRADGSATLAARRQKRVSIRRRGCVYQSTRTPKNESRSTNGRSRKSKKFPMVLRDGFADRRLSFCRANEEGERHTNNDAVSQRGVVLPLFAETA